MPFKDAKHPHLRYEVFVQNESRLESRLPHNDPLQHVPNLKRPHTVNHHALQYPDLQRS